MAHGKKGDRSNATDKLSGGKLAQIDPVLFDIIMAMLANPFYRGQADDDAPLIKRAIRFRQAMASEDVLLASDL